MTKSERTRQMIIEHAAPIFNEKGIAGTSIDDVLLSAGVAKGCLYGHFESKEELSYASLDYMLGKLIERRESFISPEITAKDKLYAYMEMHKNPLKSMFPGGCPLLNFSAEADDTNPIIKQKIKKHMLSAIKTLGGIIRGGIESGEFDTKLDPNDFATKMFSSIEGGIMLCRITQSISPMQTITKSLKDEIEYHTLKK